MHIFSLNHPKRGMVGEMNTAAEPNKYLDSCDDTPTYLDLINDGWTDPYLWNDPINHLFSNNILDYSADQRALTPCQINKVHSYIDASLTDYIYGNFISTSKQITSFSDNAAFNAETVEIPYGSSITIANGKKLYIDAEEFVVNLMCL